MNTHSGSQHLRHTQATLRAGLLVDQLEGDLLRSLAPTAPALTDRIASQIQSEVSSYAGASTGRRRNLIVLAVGSAVDHFCRVVEHEPHCGPDVEHLFQQLGYREAQDGHSLDAMRAAYQIATREAWIHLHDLAARRAIPADLLPQLTQALFFYMQWLTEQVTVGHADGEPKAGDDGVVTARHQLTRRLLDGRSSPPVEQLALAAGWPVPSEVIVVRAEFDVSIRLTSEPTRLPLAADHALIRDEAHTLTAVIDAKESDRFAPHLSSLPGTLRVAHSWPVAVEHTRFAALWVRRALHLSRRGLIDADRIVDCAEHRTQLWMHADPVLMRHTVEAILDPLLREKPHSKAVLAETLQLWLESHASAPKIAGQLGVHEQTIRQRMRRLKHLFGDRLINPPQALALLMALRQSRTLNLLTSKNTHTHDTNLPLTRNS